MKEEKAYKTKSTSTSLWKKNEDKWSTTRVVVKLLKPRLIIRQKGKTNPGGTYVKQNFPRPSTMQHYRCQDKGHVASECPNRTIVAFHDRYRTEDDEEYEKSEEDGPIERPKKEPLDRDEEEKLEENVNLACLLRKGELLGRDVKQLEVNDNLS